MIHHRLREAWDGWGGAIEVDNECGLLPEARPAIVTEGVP